MNYYFGKQVTLVAQPCYISKVNKEADIWLDNLLSSLEKKKLDIMRIFFNIIINNIKTKKKYVCLIFSSKFY